jgi:precorrin-2 dehydrogenase/sirohydrochlorin ferrochelatase
MLLPIALRVEGRRVLVVGGGSVATRKVSSLLECGARITVVAPETNADLQPLLAGCKYLPRRYKSGDCEGFALVFACTDSREVNAWVARESQQSGAWCNLADDSSASDFHSSAAVRRGGICIGISSQGGSPALSRHLKERVAQAVGDEYEILLGWMSQARVNLRQSVGEQGERSQLWRAVLASPVLDLLREERNEEAREVFDALLMSAST